MTKSLKQVLMKRDGLTKDKAEQLIKEAREEAMERMDKGEIPYDICEEKFGLEPDYITDLLQSHSA